MLDEVTPAYGRDYKSAKEAREAWKAGKDFIYAATGQYCNNQDIKGQVLLRYSKLRKVTVSS